MRFVVIAVLIFVGAAPARAQQMSVSASARLAVGEVLVLRATANPGAAEAGGGRGASTHVEVTGAMALHVSANRDWKVLVAPAAGVAVGPDFSWRVSTVPGGALTAVAGGYREARTGPVEVARGRAGRDIEIVIDYRWRAEAAPVGDPGSVLTYVVAPN